MAKQTIADIVARKKPRTKTVWLALDSDLLARIEELERQVRIEERTDERENRAPVAPRLREQLEDLRTAETESAQPFVFSQLSRAEFRKLVEAHPSEDPQQAWDEDTFAPALVSACSVDPEIPVEQAEWIWNDDASPFSDEECGELFVTALAVNREPSKVPFSVRESERPPSSEPNSPSAAPQE